LPWKDNEKKKNGGQFELPVFLSHSSTVSKLTPDLFPSDVTEESLEVVLILEKNDLVLMLRARLVGEAKHERSQSLGVVILPSVILVTPTSRGQRRESRGVSLSFRETREGRRRTRARLFLSCYLSLPPPSSFHPEPW